MPTYYATGVTATLSTCNLRPTLSHDIKLQQGFTQQENARRVQHALSAAQALPERPVSSNPEDTGVVQFIGVNADMPFYMVEAGEAIGHCPREMDADVVMHEAVEDIPTAIPDRLWSSDDSSLTSLATSPVSAPHTLGLTTQAQPNPLSHTVPTVTQKALVLDLYFSSKSFLPDVSRPPNSRGFSKSLKVEIFVNGELADVTLINASADRRRNHARLVEKEQVCFAGSRIHRQIEKPWIYSSGVQKTALTADATWSAVQAAYLEEADDRGHNAFSDAPPSANFLRALANKQLPDSLRASHSIGLIDMIITVGDGRKHGPDTPYILRPTRLADRTYRKPEPALQGQLVNSGQVLETEDKLATPTIPITIHSNEANVLTPSPKRTIDLVKELGLDLDLQTALPGSYENARGSPSKSPRTLLQRLGDLKKMNSKNQDLELQRLKEDIALRGPVAKKAKVDEKLDLDFESFLRVDGTTGKKENTTNPAVLSIAEGPTSPIATNGTPASGLQQAGGMEFDKPVPSAQSSNPLRLTPKKRSRASSLAHSPMVIPVKLPKPRGLAATPQGKKPDTNKRQKTGTEVVSQPKSQPLMTTKSATSPAQATTARKKNLKDDSLERAISAFEIPDACKGSCVTYDSAENVVRQIGKARGGDFREHSLLVGMRFVVV